MKRWALLLLLVACGGGNDQAPIFVPAAPFQLRWNALQEVNGHWWLEARVDFGRPENGVARIVVKLREVAVYDRALRETGQTVPTIERVELRDRSASVERTDVPLQSGVGFIRIDLARARGYEAGEYVVTLQRDGVPGDLGAPQQLALQGLNDTVDRRPLIFKR